MGHNVVAKAEPSPAICPGCGDGLRLDPIASAAVNVLGTRNCEQIAAIAKRLAGASGSVEGVATKPEHAVDRIKTPKTKTDIEEVTPKKIRSSMPNVTTENTVQPVHYKGCVL